MKLKYLLFFLLALLGGTKAFAEYEERTEYDAKIDGIYYSFYAHEAIVTSPYHVYDTYIVSETVYRVFVYGYSDCSGDVVIPESVTYNDVTYRVTRIDEYAFSGSDLTSVTIPGSVTYIGEKAFHYCCGLDSITIPSSVTYIGESAFSGCRGLTSIKVETGNTKYDSRNECNAIINTETNALIAGCQNTIIPGDVTSIGSGAFQSCSLDSITIPNSVTSIGEYAFSDSPLTSIIIPDSVTSIGDHAFELCWLLTSITIPNSVTSIGSSAFKDCKSLTSVTIGNGVTRIGESAFEYCSSLTDVWCYAEDVPYTGSYAFYPTDSATLHVPAGSLEAYSNTWPWSNFYSIVAIDDGSIIIEDLSELSNDKQYLIHTRDKIRGTLGVTEKHLASTDSGASGPWVCRPVVLDESNPLITNVSQLSSPYTEPTQGSIDYMIDGNTDSFSFWHSTWTGGAVENGQHYFQVEMLNQTNIDVAFKVTRRQTTDNDHITEWGVYGTNNANATKEECFSLSVIETPYNYWGETRVSDIFKTGGYKYLRFYINNTSTSRGFGHLAEFQLYPATYDETRDASPFAIIQKNGGYYLYSVRDKAFITSVNDGDENAYPLLPNDNKMNIYKHDDHFVFDFIDPGYTINVNNNGVVINDYGTLTDRFDDGNLFTIEEVGDFDPTEALAKFETQIFIVTYNVMYEGNLVATATENVTSGDALPPAPASIDNGFVTLTKTGTHPTTVTGDVTVTYTATWKGPFEFTKTAASAKWYNIHIRSGYYVGKQDTEPYYPTQNVDEAMLATPAYQWAFDGDPYHVKVYNRTTGLSETLTKVDDNAVMRSGDYTWDLLPNNDGFVLRVTGTEYSCINQFGGSSGPLQFWTDSRSLTDNGSTFRVVEAVEPSPAIAFDDDKVKALCIAQWDTNGDGELSETEAAAVTTLGTVFKGKTYITSFNELQYFTSLTSIGSNAFYNCTSLTSINIPESVTIINNCAFYLCSSLTSIIIPEKVTSIGNSAFQNCYELTNIIIPDSVTSISIGGSAFKGCTKLASITLPEGLSSIGNNAFQNCGSLTEFTIPNSMTSIGSYAFGDCTGLTEIWCNAEETPAVESNSFKGVDVSNVLLHVPENSLEQYQAHPVWGRFWTETPTPIISPLRETEKGTAIYNLAGQRLNKMQKGINIVGGKAVLVK